MTTFYLPFCVFPDWSTGHVAAAIKRSGSFYIWAERRVLHSILSIAPFILLAYITNYFLLPRYFYRQKQWRGIVMFLLFFLITFFLEHICHYEISLDIYRRNPAGRTKPAFFNLSALEARETLLCFPIIIGFSVTVKTLKQSWLKRKETDQVSKEKARAELSLLKSQVHPHFLFNTLNNIYYYTLSHSTQAPAMIRQLSDMLRYIIKECGQSYVPLKGEISMIRDYIALESIRYGDQIEINIKTEGNCENKLIAPLLLIPVVENSFKHGASKMINHQWVNMEIKIKEDDLYFLIENNKPEQPGNPLHNGHIGLKNVKKRLELLYPGKHQLNIASETEKFSVAMKIRLLNSRSQANDAKKAFVDYAME